LRRAEASDRERDGQRPPTGSRRTKLGSKLGPCLLPAAVSRRHCPPGGPPVENSRLAWGNAAKTKLRRGEPGVGLAPTT
jgi:hypothetical protein